MSHSIRTFLLLLLLTGILTFQPADAFALLENNKYTEQEKTAFAFFNLTDFEPDFKEWVKNAVEIKNLSPEDQYEILRREEHRLQSGFYSFSAEEDLLKFTTRAKLELIMGEPDGTEPGAVAVQLQEGEGVFIPVKLSNIWIAVVPIDIEKRSIIEFDARGFKEFYNRVGFSQSEAQAVVQLWLRPVSADGKSPVVISGTPYWPMMAEIGSMSIWNETMSDFAWSYDAPWYAPTDRQQYMDLYSD